MNYQFPPLGDDKDFELFMRDLLNEYYKTISFQKYDVSKQYGIDVYSNEKGIVVQCKKKEINIYSDKRLTDILKQDFDNELSKIKGLPHSEIQPKTFILATTASPSSHGEIQRYANQLTQKHNLDIQFWHWERMVELLKKCPITVSQYYSDWNNYSDERLIQFKEAYKKHLRKLENEYNFRAFRYGYANIYDQYEDTQVVKLQESKKNTQENSVVLLKNVIDFKNESQYLLIGDAGAGKSIALRTLCVELLDRDKSILPIYINLREWIPEIRWNAQNLPTIGDLKNYIKDQVCSDDAFVGKDFFYFHFQKIFDSGIIYWLFDSFDEIPAVLDGATPVCVKKRLYDLIYNMTGKGTILASRPIDDSAKSYFTPSAVLEVQGFSLENIKQLWETDETILKQIFNTPFLSAYIHNPFYAILIKYFYDTNYSTLPNSRWSVIHNYVSKRLQEDDMKGKYEATNLDVNQLISFASSWCCLQKRQKIKVS